MTRCTHTLYTHTCIISGITFVLVVFKCLSVRNFVEKLMRDSFLWKIIENMRIHLIKGLEN